MKANKLLLVAALASVGVLAACGNTNNPTENKTTTEAPAQTTTEAPAAAANYNLGLGYVTSWSGTQMNTTVVSAVFDKDGKVVSAQADVTQTKFKVEEGNVVKTAGEKSKQELGTDYNMKGSSAIEKEVYEQINAWAAYTVGKTATEVAATAKWTQADVDAGTTTKHAGSAKEVAGCTITVTDFEKALTEAYNKKTAVFSATAPKAGVGMVDAGLYNGEVSLYISGAAVEGTAIKASYTDCITWLPSVDEADATKITIETKSYGAVNKYAANKAEGQAVKSKRDLGTAYGMKSASAIEKEYNEQMEALDAFVVGKTTAEIAAFTCEDKDETIAGVSINKLKLVNVAQEAVAYAQADLIPAQDKR